MQFAYESGRKVSAAVRNLAFQDGRLLVEGKAGTQVLGSAQGLGELGGMNSAAHHVVPFCSPNYTACIVKLRHCQHEHGLQHRCCSHHHHHRHQHRHHRHQGHHNEGAHHHNGNDDCDGHLHPQLRLDPAKSSRYGRRHWLLPCTAGTSSSTSSSTSTSSSSSTTTTTTTAAATTATARSVSAPRLISHSPKSQSPAHHQQPCRAVPVHRQILFQDLDLDVGELGGTIQWSPPEDPEGNPPGCV